MKKLIIFVLLILVAVAAYQVLFNEKKAKEKAKEGGEKTIEEMNKPKSKAFQDEAMRILRALANKEARYHAQHGEYTAERDRLSGVMKAKTDHYDIEIVSASANSFKIKAVGNIDNDKYKDIIEIEEQGNLNVVSNDLHRD